MSLFLLVLATTLHQQLAEASATLAVFGHKVPDTDAISSALVYAWELSERGMTAVAYRLGDLNRETDYVLKALGVEPPLLLSASLSSEDSVAIVDTNNPEELPDGVESAAIHSVVDHHKLGGLTTALPLEVDMRPLCSATSILYARAKLANLTLPKHIAGLMLAGILSDSLEFRSPTTTATDVAHAAELGRIAGLDVHAFATEMLDAKSQIDDLSAEELVMLDTKVFKFGDKTIRISTIETTKANVPLARRSELVEAMKGIREKQHLDDVLLFVVDILKKKAIFISSSPTARRMVERAWDVAVDEDGLVVLPHVMSRKKQIVPKLEAAEQTFTREFEQRPIAAATAVVAPSGVLTMAVLLLALSILLALQQRRRCSKRSDDDAHSREELE